MILRKAGFVVFTYNQCCVRRSSLAPSHNPLVWTKLMSMYSFFHLRLCAIEDPSPVFDFISNVEIQICEIFKLRSGTNNISVTGTIYRWKISLERLTKLCSFLKSYCWFVSNFISCFILPSTLIQISSSITDLFLTIFKFTRAFYSRVDFIFGLPEYTWSFMQR